MLATQPVCFWKGRIKFLDANYQPKLSARQAHCLVYWGENWQKFREVFEAHGFVSVPSQFLEDYLNKQQTSRKETGDSQFLEEKLDKQQSSKTSDSTQFLEDYSDNQQTSRNGTDDCQFLEDKNYSSRKTRRSRGEGSGCIYYRTSIKKGKQYQEAYYQYELWSDGNAVVKSTKYIPKRLLSQVQQLDADKAPVREILGVLGVMFE